MDRAHLRARVEAHTVRPADRADTSEVVRLATGLFTDMDGEPPSADWQHRAYEALHERLDDDLVAFVVEHPHERDTLIAFAAGMISHRLPSSRNPTGRVGYIQWVATDPAWRRQGLAHAVTTAMLDSFDRSEVELHELHTTDDARALYTALGFTPAPHPAMRRYSGPGTDGTR